MRQRWTAGGGGARWWDWCNQRRVWVAAAVTTGAVPLLIACFNHIELANKLAPVAAVIVAVLALLVNSVGRSEGGEDARAGRIARLNQAAEDLASAVDDQSRVATRVLRLQDPDPLNVCWAVADPTLVDHWDNVVRGRETLIPADFSGRLDGIVDVFAKVPSRRMMILGRPGAGKSVLTIRFTRDMLARRVPGEPIPVIFPASTWNPACQSLHEWLAERLVTDFPLDRTLVNDLLGSRRVLPVLDGLDELTVELCKIAVQRLNAELDDDTPILVTCRTDVYKEITASCDVLTSALAVELLPLTLEESGRYLERTARRLATNGDQPSKSVWSPVLSDLQQYSDDPGAAALREVLSTPLMTAMARSVYSDTGRDPNKLLQEDFSNPERIEEHLLGAFVPAIFDKTTRGGEERGKSAWTAEQASRWLAFLAGHLERRNTINLAWWELETALPCLLRRLAPGLIAGCVGAVMIEIVLALFLQYVLINHWHSGTVVTSGGLAVGGVTGLTAGLTLLGRHRMTSEQGSTRQHGPLPWYQTAVALIMAAILGVAMGAVADLTYGLHLDYLGGYFFSGFLAGAALSVVFGTVDVSGRSAPLTVPWSRRAIRRPPASRITVTAASFSFGYWLSHLTNIEPGYLIPVLAGVAFGVATWLFTGVRRLTPPAAAWSSRRPMLHRLSRDFTQGLLTCFTVCLFFGLVLGTVGGAVAGWRTEMNDGYPAGSTVTTASDGTRSAKDGDGWEYRIRLDGTKIVTPPSQVNGELIVNPHGPRPIPLSGGRSFKPGPHINRWVVPPKGRGIFSPELCHDATFLICSQFTERIVIQSKDENINIRFPNGSVVKDLGLAKSISPKVVDWFREQPFRRLLREGLLVGLIGGLTLGGIGGIACGLYRWLETPADITQSSSPLSSLKTDRMATITYGGLATALTGLVCFIVSLATLDFDGSHGVAGQLCLLVGPGTVCLSAWGRLVVTRIWLGATGRLPWRLMIFLSDAHHRGVLRQSGALYQFRHLRLQQQLAADLRESTTPDQRERNKVQGR